MKSLPPELAAVFAAAIASGKATSMKPANLPPGIGSIGGVKNTETGCTSLFVALIDGGYVGINTQGGTVKVGIYADMKLETLLAGLTYTPANADPEPVKPEEPVNPAAQALALMRSEAHLTDDDLEDKYGACNTGHPSFPIDEWRTAVAAGHTARGYWTYVEQSIEDALEEVNPNI